MFGAVSAFEMFFEDNAVHLEDTKHWFGLEILSTHRHGIQEIFELATPESHKQSLNILTDKEIISSIQ